MTGNYLFYLGAAIQPAALWIGVDPFVNGVCLILIGASMAYLWR